MPYWYVCVQMVVMLWGESQRDIEMVTQILEQVCVEAPMSRKTQQITTQHPEPCSLHTSDKKSFVWGSPRHLCIAMLMRPRAWSVKH